LEVDGRPVYCRTLPPGPDGGGHPPLLLVHGISCCIRTWEPFLEVLARRDDAPAVIVPDLPAHGRSRRPDRYFGMDDFADWITALLRCLDVPCADVMGHSMGGQVAIALAQRHPEVARRLVLLGPTTGARHVSTLRNFFGLLGDSVWEPFSYNLLLQGVFWRMGPRRYLRTIREMQRDDAFARAREITVPALVLQGVRDAIIPKRVGQALAATLPRGEYAQITGAAHAAQFSHPEATAECVLDFCGAAEGISASDRNSTSPLRSRPGRPVMHPPARQR
jgi:pimeloyl-ACP methyl ester carboxylesterase